MRRSLLRAYWVGNALTLLLVVVFAAVMIVSDIETDRGSLKAVLNTASAWTAEASSNLQDLADRIAASSEPLRVTFLLPNGIILADSGQGEQDGQALLSRPEVRQALLGQVGDDLSFSESLIHPSLNAAVMLGNRLILHLKNPIREIEYLVTIYLPLIALMFLVMVAVCHWLLEPVTRRMVRQLEQVRGLLEGTLHRGEIDAAGYYPELKPALESITYLIGRMQDDLEQIVKTQDMQRDFVDNSSHELKSPLTSIAGFAEMMEEEPDMPAEQRGEYLGYILAECRRMTGIINDILLLEKQDRVEGQAHGAVSLRKVADQVAAALQPQAAQKDIGIRVSGQCTVRASEQDMWELLRNLMGNAVRYGRRGGFVRVALEEDALVVEDDGIGISPEHQPRIFEKFYRVDSARTRQDGGSGLGLAIVAAITNRYGAAIHVDIQPGRGSRFTVRFVRNL